MEPERALATRTIRSVVLAEPRSPDLHIYSHFAMPRLGVVLLGTMLRDLGYEVKVYVEDVAPIDLRVLERADLVGLSAITSTAPRCYELARHLRARGVPVVLGGPHPTHCAEDALEHCDFVVRGEGEVALPALVAALVRGSGLEEVPNLTYRVGSEVRHNPEAEQIRDLDLLPDPDMSLVHGFSSRNLTGRRRIVPIQTSRGCPHDCSFCTVTATFGHKLRHRSVKRVVAEMARHDLASSSFFIYDDNFTANRRRTREMLAGFLSLPVRPVWSAQVRADVARDEELLDLMARAGCETLYIGLESVNQESLSGAKKRQELAEVSENLRRIRARGIDIHGMFVFGFDTDGPGTMERTIAFAREHDLFSVQLMVLTPLPGSRWAAEMEASGRILHRNWSQYDAHHVCFAPAQVSPTELQRWQTEGHLRFYQPGRAIGALLRGDLPRAAVTLYAAKLNLEWMWRNRGYLATLHGLPAVARLRDGIRRRIADVATLPTARSTAPLALE